LPDFRDFSIDRLSEVEGIERLVEVSELVFGALRYVLRVEKALIRCFGLIVNLDDPRADALLVRELGGWQEEVVQEPPFGSVKFIKQLNKDWVFESSIAQPLPDMGPVLLLDMRVVILLIWLGSSELNRMFPILEVSDQMPLEEFAAVVAIEAKDGEWQGGFDRDDLLQYRAFSFSPDSPLFSPSCGDVGDIEAEDELSGHGLAAMSDRIGLKESRPCLIPLVGLNGDSVFKELAGLCGGEAFALNTQPLPGKQPVDGGRRYLIQGLSDPWGKHSEGLLIRFNPAGQDRFEALGAGIMGSLPDAVDNRDNLGFIVA